MSEDLHSLLDQVRAYLDDERLELAVELVRDQPAPEIADLFRALDSEHKIAILRRLDPQHAAAVLSEVDDRGLPDLLELLRDNEIVGMLDTLPSDDGADLVGQLEDDQAGRVLEMLDQVDHQDAVELTELLKYPEDSAGGVMDKEYVSVRADDPVGNAVDVLRALPDEERDTVNFAFVVDAEARLVGRIPLLKTLLSDPSTRASELMEPDPISAQVLDDQEEVAQLIARHGLLSLPVVDDAGRLVGRVTVDDAMDVLEEEATEDVARLAGSSEEEVGSTSVFRISRARLPWLMMGVLGQLLAAVMLSRFEANLRSNFFLFFFIPLVMATGGNTGIQTSTIVIRRIVTGEFETVRVGRHLARELGVNLLNGLMLAGLTLGLLLLAWRQDLAVSLVVSVSLMAVVLMSAGVGAILPLLLGRLKIDPTVATGPFITTVNDILGIAVYLLLAHWLLTVL